MNVQILKKDDVPEYAVLPYSEYQMLLESVEMADDVAVYRQAKRALSVGDDELLPFEVARRLAEEPPLRVWREHRGLTQAVLAERAGVSQAAIAGIERGKREPSVSLLRKLADILQVDMDDLVAPVPL